MIRGIDKLIKKIKGMKKAVVDRVCSILYRRGMELIKQAEASHTTHAHTMAQENAYVCAVYYDGKLKKGPYVAPPTHHNYVPVDDKGRKYPDLSEKGRRYAEQWGKLGYQQMTYADSRRGTGFELMLANCMFYSFINEEYSRFEVIKQVYETLSLQWDTVADLLKEDAIDISKGKWTVFNF